MNCRVVIDRAAIGKGYMPDKQGRDDCPTHGSDKMLKLGNKRVCSMCSYDPRMYADPLDEIANNELQEYWADMQMGPHATLLRLAFIHAFKRGYQLGLNCNGGDNGDSDTL